MVSADKNNITYTGELLRKTIHLSSAAIPVGAFLFSESDYLLILTALLVFAAVVEFLRHTVQPVRTFFNSVFGQLLRQHETAEKGVHLSGATYVLLAAWITAHVFPVVIMVQAMLFLSIGDTMAALIGRKYGKTRFLKKSLEGTVAFFVSSVVIVLVTPKMGFGTIEYVFGIFVAGVTAIAENITPEQIDDNLSISLISSTLLYCLYAMFLPL